MKPNKSQKPSFNNFLKRSYKHYYIQNSSGEWEEVDRLVCISYDSATSFTGRYPQRWFYDFESDYIVRLSRDSAGEQLYNAVRYLRRKEKKHTAEQFGCVGTDCPKCKGWEEIVDGEPKCKNCPNKVVLVALDKENDQTDTSSYLELDSGIDIGLHYETSYLIETLYAVLGGFTSEEQKLWNCLAAEMKRKDIALLFGWTEDKLYYRQTLLFKKLRSNERLKDFFENH